MKLIVTLAGLIFVSGCSTVATTGRPVSYYQEQNVPSSSNVSLFEDNAGGLDEEAIQKILTYRLALPNKSRVAIFNLTSNNNWRYYSSDFVQLDNAAVEGLIGELKGSPRVYDASFIPSLLVPEKKNLGYLRVAAVRYQADLLLTYISNCRSFEKYKFIDPNVTKAYCTVEAVALDVRSGIVPFTAVSTNEYVAEKNEQDVNFEETRKKAEMQAIGSGLKEVAAELRKYIEGVPVL